MNKINSSIINGILSLYIDDVLNEDTKTFVENHIGQCSVCKNELELLKEEVR